jgi:hypothetical protein
MSYEQNIFTAIIDQEGTIYAAGTGRQRQVVGIDTQKEQEYLNTISSMQETIDNYYNKLVELGVINPPKTPEQIALEQAAQQAEINAKLLDAINGLQMRMEELTNGNDRNGFAGSGNTIGQNSESIGQKSAGSQKRNRERKEDTSSNNE